MDKVKIILTKPILNRRMFVTGFHGIGWVGYMSIKHLILTLNCERVGHIVIPYEPAYSAYSISQNFLSTPGEIYYNPDYGITIFIILNFNIDNIRF